MKINYYGSGFQSSLYQFLHRLFLIMQAPDGPVRGLFMPLPAWGRRLSCPADSFSRKPMKKLRRFLAPHEGSAPACPGGVV